MALAVSGGADSSALLHLYARARAIDGELPRAVVLTVDHRLRPEAAAEAAAVARLSESLGFSHHSLAWAEARAGGNLQARAGAARRRLLLEQVRVLGFDTLALAHHADDQAETFLIRLARGSGVVGLAAMAKARMEAGVLLFRPFLELPKARLTATLRAAGVDWIEDPSNADARFARARLRAAGEVLDGLGLTRERLVATARAMARAASALEVGVATLEAAAVRRHPAGWAATDLALYGAAHEEVRLRLLSQLVGQAGGEGYGPRLEALEALDAAIRAASGARMVRTLAGARIEVRRGLLWTATEIGRTGERLDLMPGTQGVWRGRRVRLTVASAGPVTISALGAAGRAALAARAGAAASNFGEPAPSAAIVESVPAIFVEGAFVACPWLENGGFGAAGGVWGAVEIAPFGGCAGV